MINSQLIKQPFTPEEYIEIVNNAKLAEIGGKSYIRSKEDRLTNLSEDQLTGMLGHWAFCKWATGSSDLWRKQRAEINKTPTKGDGGIDIVIEDIPFDIKTSAMRGSNDPLRYNLPIRPSERHKGVCYILALYPLKASYVWLVGMAVEKDFPKKVQKEGIFKGAYVIPAKNLSPLK